MSLPFTRDETAAPGGQVKSALTNSIQDQIVANIGDLITAMGGSTSDDLLNMYQQGKFDGGQFWLREQLIWPHNLSFAASQSLATVISGKVGLTSGTNTSVVSQAAGVPAAPCPHSALRLRHLDASSNSAILIHQANTSGTLADFHTIDDLDTVRFVMDWRAYLTAVGANNLNVYMGISRETGGTGSIDDGATNAFVMFRKQSGDTNWQGRFSDGVTPASAVNTATPPVASTWQHFRLEYNGLSTPVGVAAGGVAVSKLYINGVKVAENAANSPTGGTGLGFVFRFESTVTGPAGDQDLFLGPVRMQWNPVAF